MKNQCYTTACLLSYKLSHLIPYQIHLQNLSRKPYYWFLDILKIGIWYKGDCSIIFAGDRGSRSYTIQSLFYRRSNIPPLHDNLEVRIADKMGLRLLIAFIWVIAGDGIASTRKPKPNH